MKEDANEQIEESSAAVNWEELRAEAAKLGITLSELQQRKRQHKLRSQLKEDLQRYRQ
jgi:hypothetical protein